MPLIATEIGYADLKRKIEIARAMRENKYTYKEIGEELCVSAPMAWAYVNNGEQLLNKYMPDEKERDKWEGVYQKLRRIDGKIPDDNLMGLVSIWGREFGHPIQFKKFITKRYEEDRGTFTN